MSIALAGAVIPSATFGPSSIKTSLERIARRFMGQAFMLRKASAISLVLHDILHNDLGFSIRKRTTVDVKHRRSPLDVP